MAYQFPKTISAARIATFVSTAAWIQGTSASEVSLPEEALNNFLRRHRVTKFSARQAPPPPEEEDEDEEKEEEDEESVSSESSISGDGVEEDGVSSVSSPDSTPSEDDAQSIPPENSGTNQAGIAQGASGQPAIGSPDPPALSPGAKVAIGVWSAVAVIAIVVLIFFFCRKRRRARLAQEEMNALRDEELARSRQGMSEAGMGMAMGVPRESVMGPAPMEPAYVRGAEGGGSVRAPSGQWMPTPPWQDDPPTWRDSHPWRQSQPSVIAAPNGLPSGVRPPMPPMPPFAMRNSKQEFDRRTEVTAETESTIFAYR
ncbi:hypothetical protein K449DRAFT_435875 [Hypoxylon sp. EC38]|nr:hypothetical protein K449DRAFT_435875 [Hypoxylon sp. EC38]